MMAVALRINVAATQPHVLFGLVFHAMNIKKRYVLTHDSAINIDFHVQLVSFLCSC